MKYKFVLILMLMGLLAACGTQATEAPAAQPTEASASVIEATSQPTAVPAATDTTVSTTIPVESSPTPETAPAGATVSFTNDILPILESRCLNCHGGEKTQEGLSVKTYADLMSGSDNGPVVVSGDAGNSLLVKLITNLEMPKKGPKLTPPQIQLITDWVSQGALDN